MKKKKRTKDGFIAFFSKTSEKLWDATMDWLLPDTQMELFYAWNQNNKLGAINKLWLLLIDGTIIN